MSAMRDVLTVFQNIWTDFVRVAKKQLQAQKNDRFTRIFFIIVVIGAFGYGGFRGYRWFIARREAKAQKVFLESMQLYMEAKADPSKTEDVLGAFSFGYDQNKSSNLAPFFLFFKSKLLSDQGKHEEALQLMETAIKECTDKTMKQFYEVKFALMKIDLKDQTQKSEGLAQLEKIAVTENSGRDMALYYLGLHYWNADDVAKAREYWEKIPETKEGRIVTRSPFADRIKEKLEQLT